jgi:hypothetical protein
MGSLFLPGPGPWEPPPLISGTSGPVFTAVTATETLTFSETPARSAQAFTARPPSRSRLRRRPAGARRRSHARRPNR